MITSADAVVEPVAMVVKPVHALITNEAVSRLLWTEYLALWADVTLIEVLVEFQERYLLRLLHVTWVLAAANQEEEVAQSKQTGHCP